MFCPIHSCKCLRLFSRWYSTTAFSSYGPTDGSITAMRANADAMLASLSEKEVRSKTSDIGDDWVVVVLAR